MSTETTWTVRKRRPTPATEEYVVLLAERVPGQSSTRYIAQACATPHRAEAERIALVLNRSLHQPGHAVPPLSEGYLDDRSRSWLGSKVADDGMRPGYVYPVIDPELAARVLLYITDLERLVITLGGRIPTRPPQEASTT